MIAEGLLKGWEDFVVCVKVSLSDLKEEERNRGARAEFMGNHHGSRPSYLPAISCKSRKVVKRLRKGDDTPRSKLRPKAEEKTLRQLRNADNLEH